MDVNWSVRYALLNPAVCMLCTPESCTLRSVFFPLSVQFGQTYPMMQHRVGLPTLMPHHQSSLWEEGFGCLHLFSSGKKPCLQVYPWQITWFLLPTLSLIIFGSNRASPPLYPAYHSGYLATQKRFPIKTLLITLVLTPLEEDFTCQTTDITYLTCFNS